MSQETSPEKPNAIREWMRLATVAEQAELAKNAGTSREYLYKLAIDFRSPTAEIAGRIEEAAKPLQKASKGRLPKLTRADIAVACSQCQYALKCLGRLKDGQ